jgi:peptidyl-tRNA hydrolase, PTH1 family
MPANEAWLIIGLGNPGDRYQNTRHNMGFMVADRIADDFRISLGKHKFDAEYGKGRIRDADVIIVKPMTFMNRSGLSISRFAGFFKVSYRHMLVVYDDIDLEFGRIKIKEKGGDGGHKGVRSTIDALGTGDFSRLRMGIGRPGTQINVSGHVLSPFSTEERTLLGPFIETARDAVLTILCKGAKAGMNQFNNRKI